MAVLLARSSKPRNVSLGVSPLGGTNPSFDPLGKTASAPNAGALARAANTNATLSKRYVIASRFPIGALRPRHASQRQVYAATIGQQCGAAGNDAVDAMKCETLRAFQHEAVS